MRMKIRIKRFDKSLPLPDFDETNPKTGAKYDPGLIGGFDLLCCEDTTIPPHTLALVPVDNAIETPPDHVLLLIARSSTPWKKGLMLANGVGVSDPFYSGDQDELKLQLLNFTDQPVEVHKGEALAQGIIVRREPVEWVEVDSMDTEGHGGYQTS